MGDRETEEQDLPYLPSTWLFKELTDLRALMTQQHQRLRSDLDGRFQEIRALVEHKAEAWNGVDRRVLQIETARDIEARLEAKTSRQHGARGGAITAGVILGVVQAAKWWFGGK